MKKITQRYTAALPDFVKLADLMAVLVLGKSLNELDEN